MIAFFSKNIKKNAFQQNLSAPPPVGQFHEVVPFFCSIIILNCFIVSAVFINNSGYTLLCNLFS